MVIKGGTGTVDTMSGGVQYISKGGTGTVSALNGGSQNIYKEGIGAVETVILVIRIYGTEEQAL